ncbi:hypothetical protein EYC80_000521 [Monilinia laxa]|uniref:Uncharacterized protein n=1 Tax=Monilinia laxa TaxID=61186 RepID=A0A5N6KB08_MONLA|nr:hypothetical protein EYC80_000521 [Monilinia laxa]
MKARLRKATNWWHSELVFGSSSSGFNFILRHNAGYIMVILCATYTNSMNLWSFGEFLFLFSWLTYHLRSGRSWMHVNGISRGIQKDSLKRSKPLVLLLLS